ncbi:MAG: HPF/RaiA family ribosome-associated protein, partial [Bacteroides sp.]|nr:HPF/RaiA family ribosome-associated protein [Bacteroides sp.]
MKLEIYGKNYNPSDLLKAVTEKKSAKLARRLKDDDNAQVKYTVTLENGVYATDLTVVTRGQSYRAEAEAGSPFDNIDVVIPRLLGQ